MFGTAIPILLFMPAEKGVAHHEIDLSDRPSGFHGEHASRGLRVPPAERQNVAIVGTPVYLAMGTKVCGVGLLAALPALATASSAIAPVYGRARVEPVDHAD